MSDNGNPTPLPIEASDVTVAYEARPVLRSVSFTLDKGHMLGVIGPNGAGKSTLLRSLLGLIDPDYGEVRIFGQPIEKVRTRIAYVPQTETVDWDFPVTVADVVLMGRYTGKKWWQRPSSEDRDLAVAALERVGMGKFAKRHIRQLSGGQQRRVFLARALCQGAELLLLDEPFAGVDAATEKAIFALIDQMADEGRSLLVVNHDLSILDRFDRVLLLNQRVIALGAPSEVVTEASLKACYGGRLSLLENANQTLARRSNQREHLARTTSD